MWRALRMMAKGIAILAPFLAAALPAAAAEETANDLLKEPAVRAVLERAFADRMPIFTRAMVDPRIKAGGRDACLVRRHGEYRVAVCGRYGERSGTGYVIVDRDASEYIAGIANDSVYTIRASAGWARTQPDFVSDILSQFAGTLPVGIIAKING